MEGTKIWIKLESAAEIKKYQRSALEATFAPFSSIMDNSRRSALLDLLCTWEFTQSQVPENGSRLMNILWQPGMPHEKTVAVKFSPTEVVLTTPISETRIRLIHGSGDRYIEVYFGSKASKTRLMHILGVAERNGVQFQVMNGTTVIEREVVLAELQAKAEAELDFLKEGGGTYTVEARAEALATVAALVKHFEKKAKKN